MSARVHFITDVDTERQVATCAGCGPESPIVYRRSKERWACRVGRSARVRRSSTVRRAFIVKWKFGISIAEYDALLAKQGGVCAICFSVCSTGRNLAVDHDHDTGRVRGLLCGRCNVGIGFFAEDTMRLQTAIAYLS